MGRVSRAEAARHREEIVQSTAKLLRERGSAGISVQDAMTAAGLTHGGFYRHFASKNELMGIAAGAAFEGMLAHLAELAANPEGRTELVQDYLSTRHRDDPGTGCPNAALAGDAALTEGPLREAYADGLEKTLVAMADLEPDEEARRRAVVDLATMVGAISLARAAGKSPLSEEILETVREALSGR